MNIELLTTEPPRRGWVRPLGLLAVGLGAGILWVVAGSIAGGSAAQADQHRSLLGEFAGTVVGVVSDVTAPAVDGVDATVATVSEPVRSVIGRVPDAAAAVEPVIELVVPASVSVLVEAVGEHAVKPIVGVAEPVLAPVLEPLHPVLAPLIPLVPAVDVGEPAPTPDTGPRPGPVADPSQLALAGEDGSATRTPQSTAHSQAPRQGIGEQSADPPATAANAPNGPPPVAPAAPGATLGAAGSTASSTGGRDGSSAAMDAADQWNSALAAGIRAATTSDGAITAPTFDTDTFPD